MSRGAGGAELVLLRGVAGDDEYDRVETRGLGPGTEVVRTSVPPRLTFRVERRSNADMNVLFESGLLGMDADEARTRGVALPRRARWDPGDGSLYIAEEVGPRALDALEDTKLADHLAAIVGSSTTALRFLHTMGWTHANMRSQAISLAEDGVWLLSDVVERQPQFLPIANQLSDIALLVNVWQDTFCYHTEPLAPLLKPVIKVRLHREQASVIETLLQWALFHRPTRRSMQSVNEFYTTVTAFLSQFDAASWPYDATLSPETHGTVADKRFDVIPGRWYDDAWMHLNELPRQIDLRTTTNRDVLEAQADLDDYWVAHIVAVVDKRLETVEEARRIRDLTREGGHVVDSTFGSTSEFDTFRVEVLDAVEAREDLNRERLIATALEEARLVRAQTLEHGVLDIGTLLRSIPSLTTRDLWKFMRSGELVAIVDHGHILYPTFQFASEQAQGLVRLVAERFTAEYPSWAWASWWEEPRDQLDGRRIADLIRAGDVDAAADAIEWPD